MATLTLKNVPDDLYRTLRNRAQVNRRSINSEALVCLEQVLGKPAEDVEVTLARLARLRSAMHVPPLTDSFLRKARDEGRP